MMRPVYMTLWQMVLVVALVAGVAMALLSALQRLFPALGWPWLMPLLLIVAADAVVTQRLVRRERLSWGEQGAIRGIEVVILTIAIRLASLTATAGPLRVAVAPWLRDPLLFFGGTFALYLLPALLTWILATMLATAVLQLDAEAPPPRTLASSIDEAMALDDRALALAQFDRVWLLSTVFALAGGTVALYGRPIMSMLHLWSVARPVVAVALVLISGLLLHSQGRFNQLMFGWQIADIAVAPELAWRWRRLSWLLVGIALVSGALLGNSVLLVPPPPLIPVLNALLVVLTLLLALLMALFGLLLLPFAWLLSRVTGGTPPAMPVMPPLVPAQIPEPPGERPLLPALVFWGCVVVLLGIAALRYLQQRQDMRSVIGRWRGLRWLLQLFGGVWTDVQGWGAYVAGSVRKRLRRSSRRPTRRHPPHRRADAQLRALYRRLIVAARRIGVEHPPSETAYEFRSALERVAPLTEQDVAGLTDTYVAARYGPQPARPQDVRQARIYWRRITRVLDRMRSQQRRASGRKPPA